jgi:hypothetical protein
MPVSVRETYCCGLRARRVYHYARGMTRPSPIFPIAVAALLASCGGGGGGGAAPPAPPPVAQTPQATLNVSNYQNAAKLAMGISSSAFTYSKLGVSVVDSLFQVPLGFFPVLPCPEGGTTSIELTDQNSNTALDPGDTVHLRWDDCRVQGTTTSGLVRVEINTATPIPDGRDYVLTVWIVGLTVTPATTGAQLATINFIAPAHYTRTSTSDHTVIASAVFSTSPVTGDSGLSTLLVDYLQDFATQTYTWSAQGTIDSQVLGGQVNFAQAAAFTGVLGEYPSAGRLTLTGNANSTARLSEEGAAAADSNAVLVSVDANGDGVADASNTALAWSAVVPVQIFSPFPLNPVPILSTLP